LVERWTQSGSATAVGRIVTLDQEGRPLVAFAGRLEEPIVARSVIQLNRGAVADLGELPAVAVMFENGDPSLPIIVGWVHDQLVATTPADLVEPKAAPETAFVDGKQILLRAETTIELVCGASSILLRSDGHVVIRGEQVVSRSTGPNKIKGATVTIN
jgi:hypothetical protein